MADNDDKDVGAVQEKPVLEDSVSAKDDLLEIVKTKPLTKEESTSVGVVQMLKMTLKECRARLCRLEKMEESYNQLRVDYARIEEKYDCVWESECFLGFGSYYFSVVHRLVYQS